MAILRSIYLKGASQRLGGVVLYQSQGRTLARELAPSVSNPRTPSQMEQRVRLANVVAFYRANRTWMPGAFEDKKQNESDYNAFVSANLASSRVATSKAEAAAGAAVVAPYKISSGSLPSVEMNLAADEIISDLNLGSLAIGTNTTVGTLSTALINNNNGIREGMQLSLIINIQQTVSANGIPYIVCRPYELIIDTNSAVLVSSYIPGGILASTGGATNRLSIDVSELGAGAATFILSETVGGKTRVSTQTLVMYGSNSTYNAYTSDQAWEAAVVSYGQSTDNFLSSDSANTTSEVILATSIASIVIGETTILPGGDIPRVIEANASIVFNLTQPIPTTSTVDAWLINPGTGFNQQLINVEVGSNGMTVSAVKSSEFIAINGSTYRFELTIDNVVYPITLYYNDGDIS